MSLISYPAQSFLGKNIPKETLYQYAESNTKQKGLFMQQIEKIIWQHKLATSTIGLPAQGEIKEIQILQIRLKGMEYGLDILNAIDSAIPYPIFFEITREDGQTQTAATYKNPSLSLKNRTYYASAWQPESGERIPMPTALNLEQLYRALFAKLLPQPIRVGETLPSALERMEKIAKLQMQIEKKQKQLAREKQFNRKTEFNRELRQMKQQLNELY
ncbi:DUF4391 domain-containing protein [Avibacterium paragallinarum]|uniref:DUF4391 domain-containing protein n=1 Tax=Avibacterium paragallinarum TaxID=728 RepID=A0ABU7QNA3_AVIPA|nr:DUF4391 domain-containing protein [Avibacterium paragallinarum]